MKQHNNSRGKLSQMEQKHLKLDNRNGPKQALASAVRQDKSLAQAAGAGLWRRGLHTQGDGWGSRALQEQKWKGAHGRLTGGGSLGCRMALQGRGRCLAVALGLLEDVQAFPQTAEGGSGCGLEQQEVLVQTGQGASGGKGVNGVDQVLLLALCLRHHLGTRNGNVELSLPGSPGSTASLRHETFVLWGQRVHGGLRETRHKKRAQKELTSSHRPLG